MEFQIRPMVKKYGGMDRDWQREIGEKGFFIIGGP